MGDFSDYRNECFFSNKRKHNKSFDKEKLAKECMLIKKYISFYHISLVSLSRDIPNEGERNILLNVARFIADDEKLVKSYKMKKIMPKVKIGKMTRVDLTLIQRYIDYLKLYTIIYMDKRFVEIIRYLNIEFYQENRRIVPVVDASDKKDSYKGIAIDISRYGKSIYILTRQGIIADVKYLSNTKIGDEILSKVYKYIPNWVRILAVASIISIVALFGVKTLVEEGDSKIIINTTSSITLDVNAAGKIVDASSRTEKGKLLIEKSSLNGHSVDTAILKILEFADDNEMIPSDSKINMSIDSDGFDTNTLTQTIEYVEKQYSDEDKNNKHFRLVINNNGVEKTVRPKQNEEN